VHVLILVSNEFRQKVSIYIERELIYNCWMLNCSTRKDGLSIEFSIYYRQTTSQLVDKYGVLVSDILFMPAEDGKCVSVNEMTSFVEKLITTACVFVWSYTNYS